MSITAFRFDYDWTFGSDSNLAFECAGLRMPARAFVLYFFIVSGLSIDPKFFALSFLLEGVSYELCFFGRV